MKLITWAMMLVMASSLTIAAPVEKKSPSRFERLELFNKILHLIETQYYREVDMEKLIHGALKGMMHTLDPHSSFLDKTVFQKMQEETQGHFGGLGLEVRQKDGVLVVVTPIDDTPAFKAGIKAGDKIVEINHDNTIGITLEESVEKMRGKPNTKVVVGVIREGVEGIQRFTLKREIIKVKSVKHQLINDQYAYIRLTQFQKNSTKEIEKALKSYQARTKKIGGLKGIVLDLRANHGGLLDEAVGVSSLFLKDGIVVSTEGRDPKHKEIRYVKKIGHKDINTPLIVLINGSSASASEIVAGALQDHGRSLIMGTQSFGKGTVQSVAKVDKDNGVKLTIAQYMTPKGRKIQARGIIPDIEVDEYEGIWSNETSKKTTYLRERDLRGHLNASIETKEEKEQRLKEEKEERRLRIKNLREKNKGAKKGIENPADKYNPKTDYQIVQALKFLKTIEFTKANLSK